MESEAQPLVDQKGDAYRHDDLIPERSHITEARGADGAGGRCRRFRLT